MEQVEQCLSRSTYSVTVLNTLLFHQSPLNINRNAGMKALNRTSFCQTRCSYSVVRPSPSLALMIAVASQLAFQPAAPPPPQFQFTVVSRVYFPKNNVCIYGSRCEELMFLMKTTIKVNIWNDYWVKELEAPSWGRTGKQRLGEDSAGGAPHTHFVFSLRAGSSSQQGK